MFPALGTVQSRLRYYPRTSALLKVVLLETYKSKITILTNQGQRHFGLADRYIMVSREMSETTR